MRTSGRSGCVWLVMSVLFAGAHALAQDYPAKPIRFVVTNAPGGGTDMMARLIAQKLTEAWGQTVVVDNRPGGNGAVGSLGHMMGELFQSITLTKIVHVPYKGSGSALTDLLGGYVQLMFSGPGAARPHVRARRLKALAVTSRERAAGIEEVPTFAESGYPAMEAAQWYGVLTTAGTPKAVVDKINRETVRILQLAEVKERFLSSGYNAATSTPQEFAQIIKDDLAKWQKVVKASGMPSID